MNSSWSHDEINAFTEYAFRALKALCLKDGVLDANRIQRLEGVNAKVHFRPEQSDKGLKFYRELQQSEWWLHSCVSNMVELLVKLNPCNLHALVESIDHPVVLVRTARSAIDGYKPSDRHISLDWISGTPADSLVALAIVHILDSINNLDSEFRWEEGRVGEYDVFDPDGIHLFTDLVERLSKIEPLQQARWLAELLSYGVFILNAQGRSEKPHRVKQLEELCTAQLEVLIVQHWSEELLDSLCDGLCLTQLIPRTLPIAQVALNIREAHPARSQKARRTDLGCTGTADYGEDRQWQNVFLRLGVLGRLRPSSWPQYRTRTFG